MQFLTYVLAFVAAVGIIVTVHEFGHYWVAKKLGVKVLRFSVGFGKPLFTKLAGTDKTEYVLASIPLGGYVKMLDEREGEVSESEAHRAFNRQHVWKRFAIVSAGPIFNFIFAVFAYWITFVAGVDGVKPTVGEIQAESIAANAKIEVQDTFTHIEGEPVKTWQETSIQMLNGALKTGSVNATLSSDGSQKTVTLDLNDTKQLLAEGNLLEKIGISPWRYQYQARFGEIKRGVAKDAGVLEGDQVVSVDGKEIDTWVALVSYIQERADIPISFVLQRGAEQLSVQLTPRADALDGRVIGRIGAYPYVDKQQLEAQKVVVRYGPIESMGKGLVKTWEVSILTLKLLWKLVVGEASLKNISGPVTIAEYAGVSAAIGFSAFVGALAIISISIGILNLLPIPVLDGGHLFYYLVEMVKGSPVSEKIEAAGQRLGIIMLAGLMGLAFYNDIQRLLQ
ncbi:MAG: RIP metalloprotease RseP [Gammaproteobacteria bacterium]|nr:MAG: RIP metalloprotease RseP [Gammaproteobacteria bacterium]